MKSYEGMFIFKPDLTKEETEKVLGIIGKSLLENANSVLEQGITPVDSLQDAYEVPGIVKLGWCGEESCGLEINDYLGVSVLGTPVEGEDAESYEGSCASCGRPTTQAVYVAKSY